MSFINNYDLKVNGYVKVGPVNFDINFDLKDSLPKGCGKGSVIELIKDEIEKKFGEDVKYDVIISGYMDCLDILKAGEVKIHFFKRVSMPKFEHCPSCGSDSLTYQEGCAFCMGCGYSHCSN